MDIKILYEDKDVLVVDKPAGIVVFHEMKNDGEQSRTIEDSLIDLLIEKYPSLAESGTPPRYGVVHRLDKDTSGILLVAKSNEGLIFFQKQFKNREVEKKYIALATGIIKESSGRIETFIERSPQDPRKQRALPKVGKPKRGARDAISEYKVLERFSAEGGNYTLLEVKILTGRRHQIRCHLSYIHHPIAGDELYGFKDSPCPEGLKRQFLHASYLKIKLLNGQTHEFYSELPEDLKHVKIIGKI